MRKYYGTIATPSLAQTVVVIEAPDPQPVDLAGGPFAWGDMEARTINLGRALLADALRGTVWTGEEQDRLVQHNQIRFARQHLAGQPPGESWFITQAYVLTWIRQYADELDAVVADS